MNAKVVIAASVTFSMAGFAGAQHSDSSRAPFYVSGVPSTGSAVEGSLPINRGGTSNTGRTAGAPSAGGSSNELRGAPIQERAAVRPAPGTLKDPIELCEKLAGVEREICVRQAQENKERALAPALGTTPGTRRTDAAAAGQSGATSPGRAPK